MIVYIKAQENENSGMSSNGRNVDAVSACPKAIKDENTHSDLIV